MNEKNNYNGKPLRHPSESAKGGQPSQGQRPRRPLTEEEKRILMRRRAEAAKRNAEGGRPHPENAVRRDNVPPRKEGMRPDGKQAQSRPAPQKPSKKPSIFSRKPKAPPEPPPRRRNDESYVFSRSLSETHERIMAERRERLEDARIFRREDVRQKVKYGIIAFSAVLALAILITAIAVSCSLSGARIKKGEGEYTFTVGKNSNSAAYKDTARGGIIYINMNAVAELCDMKMSGSTNDLRFTTSSGLGWISFTPDSTRAKINGYGIEMPAPAKMKDTQCSIPLDFLTLILDGVEVKVDENEKKVTVTRKEYNDSTPLEPHYLEISFMLKADIPLSSLDENKYFAGQPLFIFKNDLTSYEEYMNPSGDKMNDFLLLVNKQHPIGSDFTPDELSVIPKELVNPDKRDYITLDLNATAIKALEAMMKEMQSAGFTNVFVTSAYRSYSYQSSLYNTYIEKEMAADPSLTREEAKAIVETYSAIPGYSEHHSGLCIDFMATDMSELTNEFADKEVYDWLCANAWKFGFIQRYPEDKVSVTGYDYESWHWRFVGRTHALAMLQSGECLEEYLARTGLSEEDAANG